MRVAPSPSPVAVDASPNPWLAASLCALAVLLPRALLFPFNENLYGDAVARTELAEKWLSNPHWIRSFQDGAFQFGPLHLYLLALFLKLFPDREHAGRLLSLVCGAASAFPLYFFTRRLFHHHAAVYACLALALWGMHIQMSDTAGSEALSVLLTFVLVAALAKAADEGRLSAVFGAALVLNLLCAVRYDAWLLVPLCTAGLALSGRDRVASVTRAVLFGFAASPFILLWIDGNESASGNPFFPIDYIDGFHREWVKSEAARFGSVGFRVYALLFWPGVALFTLGPLVAVAGARGMFRAWKEGRAKWLLAIVLVPTVYFALKGAVMMTFAPLARFAVGQVALLLPFAFAGFGERKALRAAGLVVLFAVSAGLLFSTFDKETLSANALRPVSPVSQNPADVMRTARAVKDRGLLTLIESQPGYLDMQIAFFSGLPETRLIRERWKDHGERLAKETPELIVRVRDEGAPPSGAVEESGELLLKGGRFREEPGDFGRFRLYRRY